MLLTLPHVARGRPSVGFFNPALYAAAAAAPSPFNDVTAGNNSCTDAGGPCCAEGFGATAGWDPASGLGTIDYAKLAALVTGPPPAAPQPPPPPRSPPPARGAADHPLRPPSFGVGVGVGLACAALCVLLLAVAKGQQALKSRRLPALSRLDAQRGAPEVQLAGLSSEGEQGERCSGSQ